MATSTPFEDYDHEGVYTRTQEKALRHDALNFVVKFGPYASNVGSDVALADFEALLKTDVSEAQTSTTPAIWINFWNPGRQRQSIELLGRHYGFSPRLIELLCTVPPIITDHSADATPSLVKRRSTSGSAVDVEKGQSISLRQIDAPPSRRHNFYDIARNFTSYQSIDIGEEFICIGANWQTWLHDNNTHAMKRTWCWFVLCCDATVISVHECSSSRDDAHTKAVRSHFLDVLKHLSEVGRSKASGIDVMALRLPSESNTTISTSGQELASNLFYYLFDNWESTITTLNTLRAELEVLGSRIMTGLDPNVKEVPARDIIPHLNEIGKQLRLHQHLYKGYENLIARILEFRAKSTSHHLGAHHHIVISQSACYRFERLRDHIKFLVLNYLDEAIGEKDGLFTTYFNITTQKDSQATAKLSSSAATLGKLGVLFLPVSLMTAYFSVQIEELEGVYTAKTYWVSFAVVMVLSVMALFMFSSVLNTIGNRVGRWLRKGLGVPG